MTMPAKKSTFKQPTGVTNNTLTQRKVGSKKGLWIGLLVIGVFLILIGAFYWFSRGGDTAEQQKMTGYLKEKYSKEFIVGRPERKASGLGVEGYLESIAYPKDDTNLTFKVWTYSAGTHDEYAGAVWQREESKRLEPIVHRAFNASTDYSLNITTSSRIQGKTVDVSGEIPAFKIAAKKYGHNILYELRIKGRALITDSNKDELSSQVYEFLKNINTDTDVIFSYSVKVGDNREYGLELDASGIAGVKSVDDLKQLYKESRVQ